jgi:hypothetical protein
MTSEIGLTSCIPTTEVTSTASHMFLGLVSPRSPPAFDCSPVTPIRDARAGNDP